MPIIIIDKIPLNLVQGLKKYNEKRETQFMNRRLCQQNMIQLLLFFIWVAANDVGMYLSFFALHFTFVLIAFILEKNE